MDTLFTVESLLLGSIQVKDIGDLQALKAAHPPKEAENCQPGSLFQTRNRPSASNHNPPERWSPDAEQPIPREVSSQIRSPEPSSQIVKPE